MAAFAGALHNILPRPCYERPFVCDGPAEQCIAVVVGENPATDTRVDWWSYWSDSTGFNFSAWTAHYARAREQRGKNPTSPTRLRLNKLRSLGVRCLETNVFFNERPDGAGQGASNADLLALVFTTLPGIRFVIAHGDTAKDYMQTRSIPPHIAKVFRTRHFRLESYQTVERIASEILAA